MTIAFSRQFAMPSPETLSMRPAAAFVARHIRGVSVDPFARNSSVATHTNDIDPQTTAQHHMEAVDFLEHLRTSGVVADSAVLDPPYSPTQVARCYRDIGRPVTTSDTQNGALYRRVRDAVDRILKPGGTVVSFGWNSSGMGKKRGYRMLEIMLIQHGGAHNDTIVVAEVKDTLI